MALAHTMPKKPEMAIGYLEAVGYLYGYRNIHLRHIKEMPGSHRAFGRAREHLPAPYQEDAGAFARAYATLPGHLPAPYQEDTGGSLHADAEVLLRLAP